MAWAKNPGFEWKDAWDEFDQTGQFRRGYVDDKLLITNEIYSIVKDAYKEYTTVDHSLLDPFKLRMLTQMANKGLFGCVSSGSPFPCQLDNQCATFGFKTPDMKNARMPNIGVLAAGNLNSINSTIDGKNVSVSGMKYDPPAGSSDIFVGLANGGMDLPKTNSEQFSVVAISIIVITVVVLIICISGIITVGGGFGQKARDEFLGHHNFAAFDS